MTSKSFHDWSKSGYKIKKGEHGIKNGNSYYFREDQVVYSPSHSYNSTFAGCTPKGTGQLWGDLDDDPEAQDNPMYFDYVGRAY